MGRISMIAAGLAAAAGTVCGGTATDGGGPTGDDHGGVIAYCYQPTTVRVKQIWVVNADGTGNQRLVNSGLQLNHHDFSPDGTRLALVSYPTDTTQSIYVVDAGGSNITRLTDSAGVVDTDPAWSPDGTRIAFTRVLPSRSNREEIWMMNADGSDQRFIGIQGMAPEWSPSGTRLIYSSSVSGNYEIYTADPDGTDERRLTSTPEWEWFPAWSPDGTRIAFSAVIGGTGNSAADQAHWEVLVMNADGSNVVRLTDNSAFDGYPKWSPDGGRISFESDRHQAGKFEVYVMNADGSDVRRLTTSPNGVTAINPVWKPAPRP